MNENIETEVEVAIDFNKFEFGKASHEEMITYAEQQLKTNNHITVVVSGRVPFTTWIRVQHIIESAENVIRFDIITQNGARFTVFDYSEDEVIA